METNNTGVNLDALTQEQQRQLVKQVREKMKAEKEAKQAEIDAYKNLIDETVKTAFPRLSGVSEKLAQQKAEIRKLFNKALEMKCELYGVKEGQQSHTFTDTDAQFKITVGYCVNDRYDDTAESGIAMVREYLTALGDSDKAKVAVDMCLSLLAKDSKGTLKASKIMTLRKYAVESGDENFIRGVDVIMDAYRPERSKEFIRAEYKNEIGQWVNLPLGMTEA